MLDEGIKKNALAVVSFVAATQKKEIESRFNLVNEAAVWDVPIPAGVVQNPIDRFILEEDGVDVDEPLIYPVSGGPSEMTLREIQLEIMRKGGENLAEWVPQLNKTEDGLLVCDLLNDAYKDMIEAYEGESLEWEVKLLPAERLTMALVEGSEAWPEGASEEEAIAWIAARLQELLE